MFLTAKLSERGARPVNEDAAEFYVDGGRGCWVVADGLGGHGGGEIASALAVTAFLASFQSNPECTPEAMRSHLFAANQAIVERQLSAPDLSLMRSTIVAMVACESSSVSGHAGDSRLYHFREGKLVSHTRDHSVPQALADAGEIEVSAIRAHEDRNSLLRSLGSSEKELKPEISAVFHTRPGDAFLLCTDGLWEPVVEQQMETDLRASRSPEEWLERMHLRIRQVADPEQDNYSGVAVWRRA